MGDSAVEVDRLFIKSGSEKNPHPLWDSK